MFRHIISNWYKYTHSHNTGLERAAIISSVPWKRPKPIKRQRKQKPIFGAKAIRLNRRNWTRVEIRWVRCGLLSHSFQALCECGKYIIYPSIGYGVFHPFFLLLLFCLEINREFTCVLPSIFILFFSSLCDWARMPSQKKKEIGAILASVNVNGIGCLSIVLVTFILISCMLRSVFPSSTWVSRFIWLYCILGSDPEPSNVSTFRRVFMWTRKSEKCRSFNRFKVEAETMYRSVRWMDGVYHRHRAWPTIQMDETTQFNEDETLFFTCSSHVYFITVHRGVEVLWVDT